MTKLCAALALACVMAAGASTAAAAPSEVAAYATSPEARARAAVAPIEAERAFCVRQSPRRTLCLLAHPDAGGKSCRSAVLVHPRRVRVIQRSVCFEFREVIT